MRNAKLAVLTSKVFEKYQKLWDERFYSLKVTAKESFKLSLLHAPLTEKAKDAVMVDDFNFVLPLNFAIKIMKYYESKFISTCDQEAGMAEIWAEILKSLYNHKVELNLDNKEQQNDNLLNNIWPIFESIMRILDGFEMTPPQKESMERCFSKFGYVSEKVYCDAFETKDEKLSELKKKLAEAQKTHHEDEKKIADLEAKLKKYTKLFDRLKNAV